MARHPSYLRVVREGPAPDRSGWLIEFRLAPFWWARPSFWLAWWRLRGLR